jgi:hypothetical protein
VSDDQAEDVLGALLPDASAGMIRVFGTAERCTQLVADRLGWRSETVTAMVSGDLCAVPALRLPADLHVQPVRCRRR